MKTRLCGFALAASCFTSLALCSAEAAAAPWDKPGWNITFHDEFDQATVDIASWKKRYKRGEASAEAGRARLTPPPRFRRTMT